MKIYKRILVENFADYKNNQSKLIGERFECNGLVYDIDYAEMNCPLEDSDILFLNTLKRYSFGTKEIDSKEGYVKVYPDDFEEPKDIESFLKDNDYIFARVNAYIHSGIVLSLGNTGGVEFSDRWDTSLAGFLCVRKEKLKEMRGVKRLTQNILDKEFEYWEALIKETNYWLNGDVYDVQITTKDDEPVDCFTSYGLYDLQNSIETFMNKDKQ